MAMWFGGNFWSQPFVYSVESSLNCQPAMSCIGRVLRVRVGGANCCPGATPATDRLNSNPKQERRRVELIAQLKSKMLCADQTASKIQAF